MSFQVSAQPIFSRDEDEWYGKRVENAAVRRNKGLVRKNRFLKYDRTGAVCIISLVCSEFIEEIFF